MGKENLTAVVLDAGALIAFERADPRMRALLREALQKKVRVIIPAGVVGQVFGGGARQALLRSLLAGPTTQVPVIDQVLAEAAGILCGRTRTSDVIDATVVLTARKYNAPVVTSDVGDLRKLDPRAALEKI